MVIGVDEAALAARSSEQLGGAVGEHLVEVHVGMGSRTGLPDHQRELPGVAAGDHLLGGADDRRGQAPIEQAEIAIGLGGAAFHRRQRGDQERGHALAGDAEMLEGALRLRPPQASVGHGDLAEGVALDPAHGWLPVGGDANLVRRRQHPPLAVRSAHSVAKSPPWCGLRRAWAGFTGHMLPLLQPVPACCSAERLRAVSAPRCGLAGIGAATRRSAPPRAVRHPHLPPGGPTTAAGSVPPRHAPPMRGRGRW